MPRVRSSKLKRGKPLDKARGKLTVIAGPMFAGKTNKLLTIFSVLSRLGHSILCFKAEAISNGGMGHTLSHDERQLPVIYIDRNKPEKILQYACPELQRGERVGQDGIRKVIIDSVQFFPKDRFLKVVKQLLAQGIDVYCDGLIYDFRKREFGATRALMKMADECIEQYSICVRCASRAEHTERVSGGTEQSVGTTGKKKSEYIPVCERCHRIYGG